MSLAPVGTEAAQTAVARFAQLLIGTTLIVGGVALGTLPGWRKPS